MGILLTVVVAYGGAAFAAFLLAVVCFCSSSDSPDESRGDGRFGSGPWITHGTCARLEGRLGAMAFSGPLRQSSAGKAGLRGQKVDSRPRADRRKVSFGPRRGVSGAARGLQRNGWKVKKKACFLPADFVIALARIIQPPRIGTSR